MSLRKSAIDPEFTKFGFRVREILKDRKISREKFSEDTDVSINTINKICNGKQMPSIKLAVEFSRKLDISLDELFDIKER